MDPKFLINPVPAEAQRTATINYVGGSITASRGVLAQIFNEANTLSACNSVLKDISVKGYERREYIGGPTKTVQPFDYQTVKYPYQVKGMAAGGEPIMIRIQGEWWSARLSGNHSNFDTFLCGQGNENNIAGTISWKSARGSYHGPFTNQGDSN